MLAVVAVVTAARVEQAVAGLVEQTPQALQAQPTPAVEVAAQAAITPLMLAVLAVQVL
jgi:hypothetical protein